MTEKQEVQITNASEAFQNFVFTQMMHEWIRNSPDPYGLVAGLIRAWLERMNAMFDETYREHFEKTGMLGVGRGDLDAMLEETAKRIRGNLHAMLANSQKEADGLVKKFSTAHTGESIQ